MKIENLILIILIDKTRTIVIERLSNVRFLPRMKYPF